MNGIAVIVEPREHKALSFVIQNALEILPDTWKIRVYYGSENKTFVKSLLKNPRVSSACINVPNLTVEEYSALILTKSFWESIPHENVLIFQVDSIMLKNSIHNIVDYEKYDYVGAPWKWFNKTGNGGFSFRKKSAMLKVINYFNKKNKTNQLIPHPEDLNTVNYMEQLKLKVAPIEIAKTFSVESMYYPVPFGIHKPWMYLPPMCISALIKHPEVKKLMELNGVEIKNVES